MSKAIKFYDWIKQHMDQNTVETENGAIMYMTSGKKLLDINFKVSSYRNCTEEEILRDFDGAYAENPKLALKWVFYVGDIRNGLGERRLFRTLIKYVLPRHKNLVPFVADYNRFDSLFELFGTAAENDMVEFVKNQLNADFDAMAAGKTCSLLGKWMPSINTSCEKTRSLAKRFRKVLGLTEKEYRQKLSALRGYIDVVEKKLCDGNWSEVNYSTVPSKANLLYKEAFMRHDAARRLLFLDRLSRGEVKINASVAFPHDICHKYTTNGYVYTSIDDTLESMWKALPDTLQGTPMIVVRDGSGSMDICVGQGSTRAIDVATALAIYCSERTSRAYKNRFITFSESPRFVNMSRLSTLRDKLALAYSETECANTNVEAVFDLLLGVACKNHVKQCDIPMVLVISDMEFDHCVDGNYGSASPVLFESIRYKWQKAGYKMPRLAFWNVASRTNGVPIQKNECGVTLLSGFSPNVLDMVTDGHLDPRKALDSVLNGDRYNKIVAA